MAAVTENPDGKKEQRTCRGDLSGAYRLYRTTHAVHIRGLRSTDSTLRQLLPHLKHIDRDALIVELACGSGELLDAMRQRGYRRVVGVDASADQVGASAAGPDTIVLGDAAEYLRGLTEKPSAILAVDFLEHLDTVALVDLTTLVHNSLATGGLFAARLPNPQAPFGGAIAFGDITHQSVLAPLAAQQLFRIAGFSEIDVVALPPDVYGVKTLVRRVLWHIQQAAFRAMFSIESGRGTQTVFSMNYLVLGRKC